MLFLMNDVVLNLDGMKMTPKLTNRRFRELPFNAVSRLGQELYAESPLLHHRRPERAKRQHISSVLSRNEAARDYAYNRRLFVRVELGWYQLNPQISVRRRDKEDAGSEAWTPLCQALNLPLVTEFTHLENLGAAIRLAAAASIAIDARPLLKRPLIARAEEALRAQEAMERVREEARERFNASRRKPIVDELPKWGTPQAKAREIERIRAEIAARHAAEAEKKGQ